MFKLKYASIFVSRLAFQRIKPHHFISHYHHFLLIYSVYSFDFVHHFVYFPLGQRPWVLKINYHRRGPFGSILEYLQTYPSSFALTYHNRSSNYLIPTYVKCLTYHFFLLESTVSAPNFSHPQWVLVHRGHI